MYPGNPVEKIFWGRLRLMTATSHVYFTKQSVIQNLLHQFKYRGNKEIGLYFGRLMGEALRSSIRYNDLEALIPLPLFYKKEKKRGYNQAAVICDGMSEAMNIPVLKDVIIRRKSTETQTHRSRRERWDNIEGKFELKRDCMIMDKHVMLVDDVITTGATLEACGCELLKAKDVRLSIATLAYTSL
jgi:ComF family protein